jgi:hypothetical protein
MERLCIFALFFTWSDVVLLDKVDSRGIFLSFRPTFSKFSFIIEVKCSKKKVKVAIRSSLIVEIRTDNGVVNNIKDVVISFVFY